MISMIAEASEAVVRDLPTVIVPVMATVPLAVENTVSPTVTGPASYLLVRRWMLLVIQ